MQGPGLRLEILEVQDPKPLPSYAAGPEPDTDLTVCGHKHFALLHADVAAAVRELETLGESVLSFKQSTLEGIGEFVAVFIADNTGGLIELPQGDPVDRASHLCGTIDGRIEPATGEYFEVASHCALRAGSRRSRPVVLGCPRLLLGHLVRDPVHRPPVGHDAGAGVLARASLQGRVGTGSRSRGVILVPTSRLLATSTSLWQSKMQR